MTDPLMRRALLGGSGLEVSRISLGSWRTFEQMSRGDAEEVVAHACARGVNFFDDARYDDETGNAPVKTGWSEILFGKIVRAVGVDRNEVVVANKLWWEFWPREDAVTELRGSLERMQFERLDLLYSTWLPEAIPVPVAVEQVAEVFATGLIGAWGVVNWAPEQIVAAVDEAARLDIPAPCAAQLPYSVAQRDLVEDPPMESALADSGISLVPSSSLAGGALTGKYSSGGSGRLTGHLDQGGHRRDIEVGRALSVHADRLGTTPATLAIAFTLCHPRTASTLVGATAPWQLDQAIAADQLTSRLTGDDLDALRHLTSVV